MHLEATGYDFKGKKPGPAVHFAWLNVDRRKGSNGAETG